MLLYNLKSDLKPDVEAWSYYISEKKKFVIARTCTRAFLFSNVASAAYDISGPSLPF